MSRNQPQLDACCCGRTLSGLSRPMRLAATASRDKTVVPDQRRAAGLRTIIGPSSMRFGGEHLIDRRPIGGLLLQWIVYLNAGRLSQTNATALLATLSCWIIPAFRIPQRPDIARQADATEPAHPNAGRNRRLAGRWPRTAVEVVRHRRIQNRRCAEHGTVGCRTPQAVAAQGEERVIRRDSGVGDDANGCARAITFHKSWRAA